MAKATPTAAPDAGALVQARVLVAGQYGQPNDVVEVTEAEALASGALDSNPEAVAYALSLAD